MSDKLQDAWMIKRCMQTVHQKKNKITTINPTKSVLQIQRQQQISTGVLISPIQILNNDKNYIKVQ